MNSTGFLLVLGFFASLITSIYMHYQTKHAERMLALRTENPEYFSDSEYTRTEQLLKNGLFLVGSGVGFFTGLVLEKALHLHNSIFPMTAIGAGLGFVLFYYIKQRNDRDKSQQ